jgi:hypothetical protein
MAFDLADVRTGFAFSDEKKENLQPCRVPERFERMGVSGQCFRLHEMG